MPRYPCLLPLMGFALGLSACDAGGDAEQPNPGATTTEAAATTNPENPADEASPAMNADEPAVPSGCGADKVAARWLNALPTADVKAAIAKAVGERPIRYYGEGDAITMDFSPQRLNVELGKDGRIKLFRCGGGVKPRGSFRCA